MEPFLHEVELLVNNRGMVLDVAFPDHFGYVFDIPQVLANPGDMGSDCFSGNRNPVHDTSILSQTAPLVYKGLLFLPCFTEIRGRYKGSLFVPHWVEISHCYNGALFLL